MRSVARQGHHKPGVFPPDGLGRLQTMRKRIRQRIRDPRSAPGYQPGRDAARSPQHPAKAGDAETLMPLRQPRRSRSRTRAAATGRCGFALAPSRNASVRQATNPPNPTQQLPASAPTSARWPRVRSTREIAPSAKPPTSRPPPQRPYRARCSPLPCTRDKYAPLDAPGCAASMRRSLPCRSCCTPFSGSPSSPHQTRARPRYGKRPANFPKPGPPKNPPDYRSADAADNPAARPMSVAAAACLTLPEYAANASREPHEPCLRHPGQRTAEARCV